MTREESKRLREASVLTLRAARGHGMSWTPLLCHRLLSLEVVCRHVQFNRNTVLSITQLIQWLIIIISQGLTGLNDKVVTFWSAAWSEETWWIQCYYLLWLHVCHIYPSFHFLRFSFSFCIGLTSIYCLSLRCLIISSSVPTKNTSVAPVQFLWLNGLNGKPVPWPPAHYRPAPSVFRAPRQVDLTVLIASHLAGHPPPDNKHRPHRAPPMKEAFPLKRWMRFCGLTPLFCCWCVATMWRAAESKR